MVNRGTAIAIVMFAVCTVLFAFRTLALRKERFDQRQKDQAARDADAAVGLARTTATRSAAFARELFRRSLAAVNKRYGQDLVGT